MKENSIEKDEEILNNIKAYMQENIDKGFHKFVYNDLGYDEKCVDVINAIEHILSDYKRVLKENEELKADNYELNNRISDLLENIPIQKVKDKIKELDERIKNPERNSYWASYTVSECIGIRRILQDLLERSREDE